MTWKYLNVLLLAHLSSSLITKSFEKVKVNPNSIKVFDELHTVPGMDFFECAYFCMKVGIECKAFFITKQGSCQQVPLNQSLMKDTDAILYTTEEVQFGKNEIKIYTD